MSLFTASINSGSNGNCYYVGNHNEAILVDAGISCRETEKRMARMGLSMQNVKAIFVSHEHSDHIRGVYSIANKYHLPVYITGATHRHSNLNLDASYTRSFKPHEPVQVGELTVIPFPKFHDASHPHSFIINGNGINIGVLTDIGAVCENVTRYFKQCHAVFLESNYDEEMLETGRYPYHLKKRIKGGKGHLSNKQALQLFNQHRASFMSHVFLSHLSKENNDPGLASGLFLAHAGQVEVVVAGRYTETKVYEISSGVPRGFNLPQSVMATQMSLF